MSYPYKLLQIAVVMFALLPCKLSAQSNVLHDPPKEINMPEAILVQFSTERERIHYFTEHKQLKDVARLKRDAKAAKEVMMNDFKDHFTTCPVYFFADSNAALVKARHFENILLNPNGTPVVNVHPAKFNIVYFGYAVNDPKDTVTKNSTKFYDGERFGKGLVLLDENYVQMRRPFPFYCANVAQSSMIPAKRTKYSFRSAKFDIEYYAIAKQLSAALAKYYNIDNDD